MCIGGTSQKLIFIRPILIRIAFFNKSHFFFFFYKNYFYFSFFCIEKPIFYKYLYV